MATKKPKSNAKTIEKSKATTKPKTAAKTVTKPVSEAPKTNTVEVEETKKKSFLSGFFSKKYDANESILTIFKSHKFYGALLGELLGTTLMVLFLFALSTWTTGYIGWYILAVIGIYIAFHALSGACLNPIITVGMMATRRMSVIRGVMYIVAEIVGAWLGWFIFNGFHLAAGESAADVVSMTAIGENQFWIFAMIELFGAIIIAFFYNRALRYKRSVFTFGAIVAAGVLLAFFVGYIVSAGFFSLSNNFIFNPAAALMFQIFPQTGENFGEIFGGICQALSAYAILPLIGGVAGFYLSDFASKLSDEE